MKKSRFGSSGMVRFYVILAVIACFLFWYGGHGFYTWVTNLSPKEVTLDEYVQTKPQSKWLAIKGCYFSMEEALFMVKGKSGSTEVTEAFIPLRGVKEGEDKPLVHIVVATKNPSILALMKLGAEVSEDELKRFLTREEVRGLVRYGASLNKDDHYKLSQKARLDKDFIRNSPNWRDALCRVSRFAGRSRRSVTLPLALRQSSESKWGSSGTSSFWTQTRNPTSGSLPYCFWAVFR